MRNSTAIYRATTVHPLYLLNMLPGKPVNIQGNGFRVPENSITQATHVNAS